MEATRAMVRIRPETRVNPEIPPALQNVLRSPLARTVYVTVRIDESGNVETGDVRGENALVNEAVRSAVAKWKFFPAIVQSETRCVETVLPIAIAR